MQNQVPGPQIPSNPFMKQKKLPGIQNVILVGSGKGGVGKSTVALNLAVSLKQMGKRVGLLDADIYGPSLPRLTGTLNIRPTVTPENKIVPIQRYGISLMSIGYMVEENAAVVWRGPMLFKAMDQMLMDVAWGELDFLIVDLPPGTGDVALTLAQKATIMGAVVVCTPQNLALSDARKAVDMFDRIQIPVLGFIENMSYFKAPGSNDEIPLFPPGDLNLFLQTKGIVKLARLPFEQRLGMSCEAGIPFVESESGSAEANLFASIATQLNQLAQIDTSH